MRDIKSERCQLIAESLDAIRKYMEPIRSPNDFVNLKLGGLHLDGVTLRLQVIGENVKQI